MHPTGVTVQLKANAKYTDRKATLTRVDELGDGVVGVLEVTESQEGRKLKKSRYAICETSTRGMPDRHFKLTKPKAQAVYFVCLTVDPLAHDVCECPSYEQDGTCKHIKDLRVLLREGLLTRQQEVSK